MGYKPDMLDFSTYKRFKIHQFKNIMAIDFGTKVIGTAFYRPGVDPFPYVGEKILFSSIEESLKALIKICENEAVEVLVLGIPYYLDGKESQTTARIKDFGLKLQAALSHLEYYEQDETLTTKAAEERMKNSAQYNFRVDPTKIDCVSACIILEDFIRS